MAKKRRRGQGVQGPLGGTASTDKDGECNGGDGAEDVTDSKDKAGWVPRGFQLVRRIKEDHGQVLFGLAINLYDDRRHNLFATTGANRATVYELFPDGSIEVRQVYVDEDRSESYFCCAWSLDPHTDDPLLAVAGQLGIIRIINLMEQRVTRTLMGHGNSINDLRFHPYQPTLLLSASKDESIRLWEATVAAVTGMRLAFQLSSVHDLQVNDLLAFASSTHSHSAIESSREIQAIEARYANESKSHNLSLFAKFQDLETETHPNPELPQTREPLTAAKPKAHRVLSLDFHLDGDRFVSAGMDNAIKVWSLKQCKTAIQKAHDFEKDHPPAVPDSEEGAGSPQKGEAKRNGSATDDCPPGGKQATGRFRSAIVQMPVYSTSRIHRNYVDCVRWHGDFILSKSTHNKVVVWKPEPCKAAGQDAALVLSECRYTCSDIWFLRFNIDPAHNFLAVGNKVGQVFVYDLTTLKGKECCRLTHSQCTSTVRQTAITHDSRTILAVTEDGSIWRWDAVK